MCVFSFDAIALLTTYKFEFLAKLSHSTRNNYIYNILFSTCRGDAFFGYDVFCYPCNTARYICRPIYICIACGCWILNLPVVDTVTYQVTFERSGYDFTHCSTTATLQSESVFK